MSFKKGFSWYICTGFLVSSSSSHFLTNEHCISNQTTVNTLSVRFYYGISSGSPVMTDQYYYDKVIAFHHYGGCPNSAVEINQIRSTILRYR